MKLTASLIFIFFYADLAGQSFEAAASVPKIEVDSFYQILISPGINTYLNDDFSDIRIYDQQNEEVPYLLQRGSRRFNDYEILIKKFNLGCCTLLMLHNSDRNPTDNIRLLIRSEVRVNKATLLGSNDRQNWFTLKDWFKVSVSNLGGMAEIKVTDFPTSNYEFYFLRLNDSTSTRLNIVKAGYFATDATADFTKIPVKMTSSDSASERKTYVHLLFDTIQFIDKVEIVASGVKYFRRKATLSEKRIEKSKKGKSREYYYPIQHFELQSDRPSLLTLSGTRTQELLVVIENEDNPPITISSVKPLQQNRYLIAWLNKNDEFTLKFGEKNLKPPVYDLGFFKDSIPEELKILVPDHIRNIKGSSGATSDTFFTSKTIIWIAIIAVILVLGIMSLKLVRESGKKENKR